MQYSKSKVCLLKSDDTGVFEIPSVEGVVFEMSIFRIFSQEINTEEVNQLVGIVSEKNNSFLGKGYFFCSNFIGIIHGTLAFTY